MSPAQQPPQDLSEGFTPEWARGGGATAVYSVPGTPIISGFLTDIGEYNPELQGRNAVQVYEKMRRGDGQVEATLQALMLPVLSANWEVVPAAGGDSGRRTGSNGEGKDTAAKAKEVAGFVKENLFGGLEFRTSTGGWATQSWEEVIRNALLMLPFGCAAHEDVYTVDKGMLRLRMLADLLPITFYRWHVDEDGRTLLYLGQYGYRGARFEQVSVPADKITVFTFRREAANFWGRSVLRPAYPHWYIKNQLYRIDAISAERNSLGVPVIILPPGFSKEDHDAAVNFVTQLAAHERGPAERRDVRDPGDQGDAQGPEPVDPAPQRADFRPGTRHVHEPGADAVGLALPGPGAEQVLHALAPKRREQNRRADHQFDDSPPGLLQLRNGRAVPQARRRQRAVACARRHRGRADALCCDGPGGLGLRSAGLHPQRAGAARGVG